MLEFTTGSVNAGYEGLIVNLIKLLPSTYYFYKSEKNAVVMAHAIIIRPTTFTM